MKTRDMAFWALLVGLVLAAQAYLNHLEVKALRKVADALDKRADELDVKAQEIEQQNQELQEKAEVSHLAAKFALEKVEEHTFTPGSERPVVGFKI